MRDAPAERRARGKMLGQMDRIAVAGELREADHVGGGNGLFQALGHADLEVVEEQRAQRRQAGGLGRGHAVGFSMGAPRACGLPVLSCSAKAGHPVLAGV